ncbi:Arabinose operon regulatory protein [Poriferisphaera corsica]|uniref:Arabinose operon regulatory protein n=1 Tax=Poriferisphaera corsica TaxID=2528020 RepID=A0A517YPJ5_9BACT|nr:AraC family transcriptional regulator [Poriferisphaera corsica]QDU32144.1 Arabinose operon regulatory protein [Poriferisphaera corsica]
MFSKIGDVANGWVVPWLTSPVDFLDQVKEHLTWDSVVLGIVDVRTVKPDAILVADGVSGEALAKWSEGALVGDELFREAKKKGDASGEMGEGGVLPVGMHTTVQMLPGSLDGQVMWYLAVGRKDRAYDDAEVQVAGLLLQLMKVEFAHVAESEMGRLVLDGDNRLLLADPRSEVKFRQRPELLEQICEKLPAVIKQRWDVLDDDLMHDIVLDMEGVATWMRIRKGGVAGSGRGHLYIETRPVGEGDVPAVGVLEDERIAQAVAYLSDNFAKSPSLSEVAESVYTSPFHFHRLFSRQVGLSPKHYLLRMQLQIAKWMLRATRVPVGEVATAAGFSSHGHFTATFHRLVGVSPTHYRSEA